MKKNLTINTITPILQQLTTVISGFIVPRLILNYYGSNVNGLVTSIAQFLSVISFLEAGIGSVIRYNLYKPLAENDSFMLSSIMISANKFFKMIAGVLALYTVILMVIYPVLVRDERLFGHFYMAMLIAAMSISYLSQYYFGQINQLLLTADQKGYIQYTAQILTIILNTIACAILINCGAGIHLVKFSTSVIFLMRPLYLQWYVKHHYYIDYQIKLTKEPITQKWNGLAQHISAVVLESTDSIVLTLFSTLSSVSVYSAYNMVVYGIKTLMTTSTSGIEAIIGNILARDDREELERVFSVTEWSIHTIGVFLFGSTGILVLPFVIVYTKGVHDTSYVVPVFAVLIAMANLCHSLRLPYSICILSGGYYKQTQSTYIISTTLNIVISIVAVKKWGLVGVAVGTITAMAYQTVCMSYFCYKNILSRSYRKFVKQMFINIISLILMFRLTKEFSLNELTYFSWVVLAVKVSLVCLIVVIVNNMIFYRDYLIGIATKLLIQKNRNYKEPD